jgi:drug/metabolite transporter (DMT)-like permease
MRRPGSVKPESFANRPIRIQIVDTHESPETRVNARFAAGGRRISRTLLVATLPSLVAYYCWDRGVARAGAVLPMYFVNLTPVFAGVLSYLALDEPIGPHHLAGGALILAGIHLATRPASGR